MPQTTTAASARSCAIRIDDENGAPVDVSGSTNQWGLDLDNQTGQMWTFSGDWPITRDGKKNASLTIRAVYTTTNNEASDLFLDWFNNQGQRTVTIDYPDSSVGSNRLTGDFALDDFSQQGEAQNGEPMTVEVTLLPTNELTLTKIAS